ncbi:hypothetical protein WMF41_34660 [Sorangium sp. So ce1151]
MSIEGFIEAVALEVAPFQVEFTIAEPGPLAAVPSYSHAARAG